jgi:hypothetical protein
VLLPVPVQSTLLVSSSEVLYYLNCCTYDPGHCDQFGDKISTLPPAQSGRFLVT